MLDGMSIVYGEKCPSLSKDLGEDFKILQGKLKEGCLLSVKEPAMVSK